ncbi:MAG: hypothetical protein GY933_11630 [Hyphomicrobiales bacterium]|nr:hypothetical protein [Hyphomicrobiales bacterium]
MSLIWLVAGLLNSQAREDQIDLAALSDIRQSVLVRLLNNWENDKAVLATNGISDPARNQYLMDLIPEILADIAFGASTDLGYAVDVDISVLGNGVPDVTFPIRALPLCKTIERAYSAGALPTAKVEELIADSALANSVARALNEGSSLRGGNAAIAFVGLRHDGSKLLLE